MMVVGNVNNYAFWVEVVHYPLRKVLKPAALFKRLAAGCPGRPRPQEGAPESVQPERGSQAAGPNSATDPDS